ncbi:hypothetical protein LTR09_008250 [Extremus antarcticus]|uniref:Uncharacterized protein n=1 Tax=Extremus antarcticus TaxID=702011 RepID=A0AAJ0DHX9_9PEZI|nr:hypothetical protein LTR09_008250 [Extremus antarcticus]
MALIGQTVTIVNKSGKVVSTSKHLVNVFNEAKSAYSERKAELKALRRGHSYSKSEDRKTLKRVETLLLDDDDTASRTSSRRSSRRGSEDGRSSVHRKPVPSRHSRPPIERGVSDSFYANDTPLSPRRRHSHRPSPLRQHSDHSFSSSDTSSPRTNELTRRHTDGLELTSPALRRRRSSSSSIDMHLAYGTLPPPLPERNYDTEIELRMKMSGLQKLLDECNCLQHSVIATIDNLQKNPDALAAVALTLAEISNLATKMAPGALMSMKGAFPVIIAILASPEFLIAAGVGVGVTVVVLGGYKIIKKIKAKRAEGMLIEGGAEEPGTPESEMDSLREISQIENWRRGIADMEAESVGTSVEGEFVTPKAKTALMLEGKLTEKDLKAREKKEKKERKEGKKKGKSAESEVSKSKKSKGKEEKVKVKVVAKEKSSGGGIKSLFKGQSTLARELDLHGV